MSTISNIKHDAWQDAWSRLPDGSVKHESGLTFVPVGASDGGIDLTATRESLDVWQSHELARGVPLHDLAKRGQRLAREAGEWHVKNRQ